MGYRIHLFILILLVFSVHISYAQDKSSENTSAIITDTAGSTFVPLDRVWVANNLKYSYNKLKVIESQLIPENNILKFDSTYRSEYSRLRKEKVQFDSIKNFPTVRVLQDIKNKWIVKELKYNQWTATITDHINKLQKDEIDLNALIRTWDSVIVLANNENISGEQMKQAKDLLTNLKDLNEELTHNINEATTKESLVGNLILVVDSVYTKLDFEKKAIQSDYFVRDSEIIWESADSSLKLNQVKFYFNSTYIDNLNNIKFFVNSNRGLLVIHFILFLLILSGFYYLHKQAGEIDNLANESELSNAKKVVSQYVLCAFILSLFITLWLYPTLGSTIVDIWQISYLLIGLIFLPRYLNKGLVKALLIILLLFILDLFQMWFLGRILLGRVIMLMTGLVAALLLFQMFNPKSEVRGFLEKNKWGFVVYILKAFFILALISIVANIFGYVNLALLLSNTTVNSIINIIILILAIMVISRALIILFRTPFMQSSHVTKNNLPYIEKRLFQIIQIVGIFLWSQAVLQSLGIWDDIMSLISEAFNTQWIVGSSTISFGGIVKFIFTITFTILLARALKILLNDEFYPRVKLPRGVPGAINMISGYVIVLFGIAIALMEAGVNLSEFGLVAGALSVGIGFGLQGIVANFIAGIVLAFERPIQVGDEIQMGTLQGAVRSIGVRSTTVRTYDGSEVIIPNSDLIVKDVTNWTLSDRKKRRDIIVNAAYGTNPNQVLEILKKVASEHPDVLKVPAPWPLFDGFGDNSIDFTLRIWTLMDNGVAVQSDVTVQIYKAFEEAGIEIPFPQRDLHLKSIDPNVSDVLRKRNAKKVKDTKINQKNTEQNDDHNPEKELS